MKIILIAVLTFGLQAFGKDLTNANSPNAFLQKASQAEKKAFVKEWVEWVSQQDVSERAKDALIELVSQKRESLGPETLEAIDGEILSWFYGQEQEGGKLLHEVARVSRSTNISICLQYSLCVIVTKRTQRMNVYRNGRLVPGLIGVAVSTARARKYTPTGMFTVGEIAGRYRYSGKYEGAYLGFAMQVSGHYFLHATSKDNYKYLGRPASAGCVRMRYSKARQLNQLMRKIGRSRIRVVIR